ncbi:MAG: mannitol-1-phosphate 5-dehydrogenase, partial [Solibacillus isronensis]
DTVGQVMKHQTLRPFVQRLLVKEVIPTINGDKEQLITYQQAVLERFENPFIAHYVKSIALNAIAKFKTRDIPSLLAYYKQYETLPKHLTTALAAWIYLYQTPAVFSPQDAPEAIEQITAKPLESILSNENLWGIDLTTIPQLEQFVRHAIAAFKEQQTAQFIAELEEEVMEL